MKHFVTWDDRTFLFWADVPPSFSCQNIFRSEFKEPCIVTQVRERKLSQIVQGTCSGQAPTPDDLFEVRLPP